MPETIDAGEYTVKGFVTKITDAYAAMERASGHTQKKSFSPSTVGYGHGTCPRYWFIAFTGEHFDNTSTPEDQARMHHGTKSHDKIQDIIANFDDEAIIEQQVLMSSPPVRGFADFIVKIGDEQVVGEYKTAAQEVFIFRKTHRNASPAHVVQLLIYLVALGLDRGFVLYENKNTQELLAIEITLEAYRDYADEIIGWMNKVYQNYALSTYEDGLIPKRPFYSIKSKECKTCPVKVACYEKWTEGEVDLPALEVRK